jgi:hypothetical protein
MRRDGECFKIPPNYTLPLPVFYWWLGAAWHVQKQSNAHAAHQELHQLMVSAKQGSHSAAHIGL